MVYCMILDDSTQISRALCYLTFNISSKNGMSDIKD